MTLTALLIAAAIPTAGMGAPFGAAVSGVFGKPGAQEPQIEVWTNRQSVLLRGDQQRITSEYLRVFFQRYLEFTSQEYLMPRWA